MRESKPGTRNTRTGPSRHSRALLPTAAETTQISWPREARPCALAWVCEPMPPRAVSGGYSCETRQILISAPLEFRGERHLCPASWRRGNRRAEEGGAQVADEGLVVHAIEQIERVHGDA